ncbi:MAG: hypothetical protein GEU83_19350 [Pseudonocardiaceae bacterium]|nr:hypothetical protein [Pseudonocardiaceae bacterium]
MAKHAKPTVTTTVSNGARGAAALAMASFGFLATAPAAFAGGGDGDNGHDKKHDDVSQHQESNDIDAHESQGIVNVADNDGLVPVQVCNNYVPVNVLGVQVPIEEGNAVPILTDGDTEADSGESCQQASGTTESGHKQGFGSAAPAAAPVGGGAPIDTDAAEGLGGDGLGDVQGTTAENPTDALAAEESDRSVDEALGSLPQPSGSEEVGNPAGELGAGDALGAAPSEDLAVDGR